MISSVWLKTLRCLYSSGAGQSWFGWRTRTAPEVPQAAGVTPLLGSREFTIEHMCTGDVVRWQDIKKSFEKCVTANSWNRRMSRIARTRGRPHFRAIKKLRSVKQIKAVDIPRIKPTVGTIIRGMPCDAFLMWVTGTRRFIFSWPKQADNCTQATLIGDILRQRTNESM